MITEEDLIKRKLAAQQQAALVQAAAQQQLMQQQLEILKRISSSLMERAAADRLANLKVVKPDLALQLELYLVQLYQAGQLRTKITEKQLISILQRLAGRREVKIKRK